MNPPLHHSSQFKPHASRAAGWRSPSQSPTEYLTPHRSRAPPTPTEQPTSSPDRDGPDIIMNTGGEAVEEAFWDRDTNLIVFNDRSKFGFYEADFGWGKPVWTSIRPEKPLRNLNVLMSNIEGDGIEAWMHLKQSDMGCIEQDGEIINQITSEIIHNFLSVSV